MFASEDKCNLISFHLISLSLAIMFSWQCNHGNKERPRLHVSDENGDGKRIFSKTLVRVESFENASFSFSRGRTKTELMSNIMYSLHDSSSVRDAVVFSSFQRFHVDWRTSPFSKISTYVWSGPPGRGLSLDKQWFYMVNCEWSLLHLRSVWNVKTYTRDLIKAKLVLSETKTF